MSRQPVGLLSGNRQVSLFGVGNATANDWKGKFKTDFGIIAESNRIAKISAYEKPEDFINAYDLARDAHLDVISRTAAQRYAKYKEGGLSHEQATILTENAARKEYENILDELSIDFPRAGLDYATSVASGGTITANQILGTSSRAPAKRKARKARR